MTRSTVPPPPPRASGPAHVVHVLGGTAPGLGDAPPSAVTCAQVRSLAHGLLAHGLRVTLHAPPEAEAACGLTGAGAQFAPSRARTEPEAVRALRATLAGADLVHAHGLRAATLACLARDLVRPRAPLVVTWHRRQPAGGAREGVLRMLERRVARTASVVLCATSGLVDLARRCGARDARLAPSALHLPAPAAAGRVVADPDQGAKMRAEIGAVDRPLLFSVGRLDPGYGYGTLLAAARAWRRLEPPPLVAVAGDGPERRRLQAAVDAEELPVSLLGRRDDALALLRVADLALLPDGDGVAPPVFAQEALRAGVPVVGAEDDGIREVVGAAGLLTPPGDAAALAGAVTGLLTEPGRLTGLAAACAERVARLPTEEQTVAHVLCVYDELLLQTQ